MKPSEEEFVTADVISDLLDAMPDGNGIFLEKQYNGNLRITKCREEEFVKLGKDESLFHCVGMEMRAGVSYFCNYLENHFFPPETPENDEMQYRLFKWGGIIWHVTSVPIEKKDFCFKAAKEAKLKVQDGVPFIAGRIVAADRNFDNPVLKEIEEAGAFKRCPINGPTVFTLENDHRQKDGFLKGAFADDAKEKSAIEALWEEVKDRHERN